MSTDNKNLSASMPKGVEAVFYETVGSTNDVAKNRADAGHAGPIWVGSAVQTAGRGRLGRQWVSDKGNLYASLMIRPDEKPDQMFAVPFLTALAVRNALIKCGANEDEIQCKWPNDILYNGKKIAGVLIESSLGTDRKIDYMIIGIGTNLNIYPSEVQFPATCFSQETGSYIDPEVYFKHLAASFDIAWQAWQQFGFEPIRQDWVRYSWGLGEKSRIVSAGTDVIARLETLDKDGTLIIKLDDGTQSRLYAGDIFPYEQ